MSFFDDDTPTSSGPSRTPPRPRPRRPAPGTAHGTVDHHTLMVRRRAAALVGVVLVIIIALLVNGCLKSKAHAALETYAQHVGLLIKESDEQVGHQLFGALDSASGQTPLNVELHIDEYRQQAETQANSAKGLSVPSSLQGAQRNFLLTMDLRVEGLQKVSSLVRSALGGQNTSAATTQIAGAMEIFLASDVVYSQRVVPLISQTLAENSITGQTPPATGFLPNLGWLEASTVAARLGGGQGSGSSQTTVQPGHHGHVLKGVGVGSTTLEAEPAINHISGGSNPAFTVHIENDGEFNETNVKVNLTVTSQGKQYKASKTVNKTEPGKAVEVDIPVEGVPLGMAGKIEAQVEPVPGETNHEGTKSTYLAVFEK